MGVQKVSSIVLFKVQLKQPSAELLIDMNYPALERDGVSQPIPSLDWSF